MNNLSNLDRLLRLLAGIVLLELAYFWLAQTWQIVCYVAGGVLLATAALRFCPLYRVLGLSTVSRDAKPAGRLLLSVAAVLVFATLFGGSYASVLLTHKLFLEDFNAMNDHYKQTLFLTGKNERGKAVARYESLVPAYQRFQQKYTAYQPYALKGDRQLIGDLERTAAMISGVDTLVRTGDLHQAHLELEKVRPVFQELFKRSGFSMLGVALVDFHDAMELVLDAANAKNASRLMALYPAASDKLKAVEAEASDAEILDIRKNLDALQQLAIEARGDLLPAKGDALKSSFIKVYLKRG